MSLPLHIYLNTNLDIMFLMNKYLLFYSTSCQIEQFSQVLVKYCEDRHISAVCRLNKYGGKRESLNLPVKYLVLFSQTS